MRLIDMGSVRGEHVFLTGGRSLAELLADGAIVAIPDDAQGIVYKRPETCTPVELAARLTVDEARRLTDEWNSKI